MNKKLIISAIAGTAVSWGVSRWIDRIELRSRPEPDEAPAIDHEAVMRRLTLATEGMDEAIREGVPFDPEHIHRHVQRGLDFDKRFGNGQ